MSCDLFTGNQMLYETRNCFLENYLAVLDILNPTAFYILRMKSYEDINNS